MEPPIDVSRNAIGAARLGGLEDDLGLKGDEFQVRHPKVPRQINCAHYHRLRFPSSL